MNPLEKFIGYKVLRQMHLNRLISACCPPSGEIDYFPNKWVFPKLNCGALTVFNTIQTAKNFHKECTSKKFYEECNSNSDNLILSSTNSFNSFQTWEVWEVEYISATKSDFLTLAFLYIGLQNTPIEFSNHTCQFHSANFGLDINSCPPNTQLAASIKLIQQLI